VVWLAGAGLGLGFDLLEGLFEEVLLFLAGSAPERPGIQQRDQDGQAGQAKAEQPESTWNAHIAPPGRHSQPTHHFTSEG